VEVSDDAMMCVKMGSDGKHAQVGVRRGPQVASRTSPSVSSQVLNQFGVSCCCFHGWSPMVAAGRGSSRYSYWRGGFDGLTLAIMT